MDKIAMLDDAMQHLDDAMRLIRMAGEGWVLADKLWAQLYQLTFAHHDSVEALKADIEDAENDWFNDALDNWQARRFGLDKEP